MENCKKKKCVFIQYKVIHSFYGHWPCYYLISPVFPVYDFFSGHFSIFSCHFPFRSLLVIRPKRIFLLRMHVFFADLLPQTPSREISYCASPSLFSRYSLPSSSNIEFIIYRTIFIVIHTELFFKVLCYYYICMTFIE